VVPRRSTPRNLDVNQGITEPVNCEKLHGNCRKLVTGQTKVKLYLPGSRFQPCQVLSETKGHTSIGAYHLVEGIAEVKTPVLYMDMGLREVPIISVQVDYQIIEWLSQCSPPVSVGFNVFGHTALTHGLGQISINH